MKEYSKGIYVKFKPEEVEILHNRMKEAGVQNMSAYIRKMALNGYVIIPEWPDLNQVISLHSNKIVREIIHAKGIDIGIYMKDFENEYISLTDIAKAGCFCCRGD
ncbi:MAG: plasmid mobilization relaxosome protein MobC [Lachnoclostridium sp.]